MVHDPVTGDYATFDLNLLYHAVLKAKRRTTESGLVGMLAQASWTLTLDKLFRNGELPQPEADASGRPLLSLADAVARSRSSEEVRCWLRALGVEADLCRRSPNVIEAIEEGFVADVTKAFGHEASLTLKCKMLQLELEASGELVPWGERWQASFAPGAFERGTLVATGLGRALELDVPDPVRGQLAIRRNDGASRTFLPAGSAKVLLETGRSCA